MEQVNLGHSVKDIPVPNEKVYMQMMINSVEKFIWNLRWKTIFFLKPSQKEKKNTFGFKSLNTPEVVPELKPFEDDLIDMVKNIEFEKKSNPFQNQLKSELKEIHNQKKSY